MPQLFLKQKSEFTLAGITLVHGVNTLNEEHMATLAKEWGYTHAVEHGLIEPLTPPKQSAPSEKSKTKK
jgi:hypothetical protein